LSRLVYIAVCALGLQFCSGCIIPYAYPKFAYTPALSVSAPSDEVRAFRVDYTIDDVRNPWLREQRFSEIGLGRSGKVPAQVAAKADYGAAIFGVALNHVIHNGHSISVRLYRPGFQLNEVDAWDSGGPIEWKPAQDLAAQERVLEQLFPVDQIDSDYRAPAHRNALEFGAAEYDRLAAAVGDDDSIRLARLRNRADILRAYAGADWQRIRLDSLGTPSAHSRSGASHAALRSGAP
jgi:hypothetical protein